MQHFKIKPGVPLAQQAELGHNRWHPDLPFLSSVKPGESILIESLDFLDAQIQDTDSVDDVANVDLTRAHPLTGPFHVEGAEPGDLLVIDLLDIKPVTPVGFSGVFSKENGGGFLADYFPEADKAIWDLKGLYATSRHIPGVRIAGLTHPGLMGCLPSHDLLAEWNRREAPLAAKGLAKPPDPSTAVLRGLSGAKFDEMAKIAARTVPPREHGGNTDIKDLSAGTRIFFPVYVKGAGFSMGDLHFSQGDGEIGFCGAIEMDGVSHVGFDLIKGGIHAQHRQAALRTVPDLRRHQRRERRQLLPRRHGGVSSGLPQGHRLSDPLRLYRQSGLHAADGGTGGRTHRRHRRYSQLRLHGVLADLDLRSGHHAQGHVE